MSTGRKRSAAARTRARKRARLNQRARIYERDRGRCQYCALPLGAAEFTLDHVVPIGIAGCDATDNKVVACFACNVAKDKVVPSRELPLLIVRRAWQAIDAYRLEDRQRAARRVGGFWREWASIPSAWAQVSAA